MKLWSVISAFAHIQCAVSIPVRRQQIPFNTGVSQSLRNILDNANENPAYTYPTDLTRDIVPKPIHSHNDYWRDVPFFSALSFGCESVEADVWLYNDTLYVGHETLALTPERTFDTLYVQPILDVLRRQNPKGLIAQSNSKNGVFDTASDQTLYLFLDVKTDGPNTWPFIVRALEPLREAGYLTAVNGTIVTRGAVTVIGTGNTPLDQIQGVVSRDYFYDANAALLNTTQSTINSTVSPIASASFLDEIGPIKNGRLSDSQIAAIRAQISIAGSRGIGVRYYETPAYPISTRNALWETLVAEGVALLSVDDLAAAAGFASPAPW